MQFPGVQFLAAAAANYQQIFVSPSAAVLRKDNKKPFGEQQTVAVTRAASSAAAAQNQGELQRTQSAQAQRKVLIMTVGVRLVSSMASCGQVLSGSCPGVAPAAVSGKLPAVELNGVTAQTRLGRFMRLWKDNPAASYQRNILEQQQILIVRTKKSLFLIILNWNVDFFFLLLQMSQIL